MGKKEANANFTECFAAPNALIATEPALGEDIDIDHWCHFDCEGYAEPGDEDGGLIGIGAIEDSGAEPIKQIVST